MPLIPMKNSQVTIEVKDESMIMRYEKLSKARLEWLAPGIEIYVKGSLKGVKYEQAANLAMQECCERRIPVISLRRQK